MIRIENPPGFLVRTEAQKAAFDNGYRIEHSAPDGWMQYRSTTAKGDIWMAAASSRGPWILSVQRPEIAAELGISPSTVPGPGSATFLFDQIGGLYAAIEHVYRLGVSLPDAPLEQFRATIQNIPRTTEAECLAVRRVGQTLFRQALLDYWHGCCPLTGITHEALLRASHIVPWADCETDELRLDVHNGLLLSALWDAAFDAGLISFGDDGEILISPHLSCNAIPFLNTQAKVLPGLTNAHRANLARHRAKFNF